MTPPVINSLTLPTNQVVVYGSDLVLAVSATAPGTNSGFPLSYQWQFNGSNISWATGSSYTIHGNATSFGTYSVLVSNAAGSTNAVWLVAVNNPGGVLIGQQPASQYQIAGGNVTFAGSAVGSNSVAYQWAFNSTNIAGATNASLTLTNVSAAQQGYYNFMASSAGSSLTSSNATFYLVTPPTITSQTAPTNVSLTLQTNVLLTATVSAPGQTNGFPIHYQWQCNGVNITGANSTNYTLNANTNVSGVYSLVVTNLAGSTNASWQVTLTINVTNDLLLIYNTNSADSTTVLNYYLANRPMVGGANVLGIGFPGIFITLETNSVFTPVTNTTVYETIAPADFTNQVLNPVLGWLATNPTKRPQYVVLMLDVPSRLYYTATNAADFPYYPGSSPIPSVSFILSTTVPSWSPFITYLNMGDTNACIAYIKKLATFGAAYSPGSLIISASAGGYGNTNYVVDNVRAGLYASSGSYVSAATNGLIAAGVLTNNFFYSDGVEPAPHLTNGLNVAGYICWGMHSFLGPDYATTNGTLRVLWSGNSAWWIIRTVESFNGMRYQTTFGTILKWFESDAFGGINYSNTPVGAVSYTDEPGADVTDASIYFGLWATGQNLAICAWRSSLRSHLQVVGDPFVTR